MTRTTDLGQETVDNILKRYAADPTGGSTGSHARMQSQKPALPQQRPAAGKAGC